jgi:hypothetical protein
LAHHQLVSAPELFQGGGLAGGLLPGHDQAATGADLAPIEPSQQPALPSDLADGGGRDDDHGSPPFLGLLVGVEDAQGITCANWPLSSSSSSSQIGGDCGCCRAAADRY